MALEFQLNVVCVCGATIPCSPTRSGRRVQCPDCGDTLIVPALAVRDEATGQFRDLLSPAEFVDAYVAQKIAEKKAKLEKKALQKALESTTFESTALTSAKTTSPQTNSATVFARVSNPIARKITRCSSRKVNKYRVVNLLAKGGMGKVSLARDDEMERTVALKEIRSKFIGDASFRRRFIVEAKITGCLDHPGVAPVYSLELDERGVPFYVMRKIDGVTFEKAIAEYSRRRSPEMLKNLLRHFVAACQTLDYAHHVGVVHRDIKPSNIMIGKYDTTFVMDWGVAKKLDDSNVSDWTDAAENFVENKFDASALSPQTRNDSPVDDAMTAAHQRVGTLWYRDPDYLRTGESKPCNDVYAMGVVLYVILTGATPHKEEKISEKDAAILMRPPTPPARKVRSVPRPLSDICMKAIEKSPKDRYSSVERLADDVRRWLENEPVSATRYSFFDRLWRRYQ